jgi:hypothetical protein
MKKLIFSLNLFLSFSSLVHAQWTTSGTVTSTTNSIGIGTTAPLSKLHVSGGNILIDNASWFAVRNTSGAATPLLGIAADNNIYLGDLFAGTPTGRVIFRTNGADRLTINSNGSTGIGTNNPQSALEVNNNSYTDASQLIVSGAEATRYYGVMGITVPSGHTVLSLGVRSNNTNYFETLNLVNDNVGIGTKNPDQKLSVNGTIHSKSVLIDLNGWSDYVLKNDYQLRPLSEVKAYIDQNQHLPEIPSEQEMIKKGLDVSEMNKLLMKKVEELTLYLIEKDKQAQAQQAEIDELKTQMKKLIKP